MAVKQQERDTTPAPSVLVELKKLSGRGPSCRTVVASSAVDEEVFLRIQSDAGGFADRPI